MFFELESKLKQKIFVEYNVYQTLYTALNNLQNLVIEYPEYVLPLILQQDLKIEQKNKHLKENIVFIELIDKYNKLYMQLIYAKEFNVGLNEFVALIYYLYKDSVKMDANIETYNKQVFIVANTDHKQLTDYINEFNKRLNNFNIKLLHFGYTIV